MDYIDMIDQVISEPASRTASERNLLAEILKTNEALFEEQDLDPDDLYRRLLSGRNGGAAEQFTLLTRPGEEPMIPPQVGDILLRVAPGHPGLGHVAVIADESLWPHDRLELAPFEAERKQPGYYAGVVEAGAFPHPRSRPIARRILDAMNRMLPFQILIRPKRPAAEPVDFNEVDRSTPDVPAPFEDTALQTSWAEETGAVRDWEEEEIARFRPYPAEPGTGQALKEYLPTVPEFDEDQQWAEIELAHDESAWEDEYLEDVASEDNPTPAYAAQIVMQKAAAGGKPAELALVVDRWENAEGAALNGVRLKIFEIDTGEPGRSDTATAQDQEFAEFTLNFSPNPEFVKNSTKSGIPRVTVSDARWDNTKLEKSFKATSQADFVLNLGQRAFPLWIPREDILEEGHAAEIGFTLEDGAGHSLEHKSLSGGQVVSLPTPDYLQQMLDIPGRFDDPARDRAVEMDGTKFSEFLKGKNRREFIRRCLEKIPALKEAANEPGADLRTSDIVKAWFVIHDVGVDGSLPDRRFKANQAASKNGSVHGFLNRAGYYAATHDFVTNQSGTVYEFHSKKGLQIAYGKTINIETVPDIETGVPDKPDGSPGDPSDSTAYASIGYRRISGGRVTYYKWTKAAFDVLADLYLFASVRAGHLLTITAHKEMDRNLARSVLWREYSAQEMRNGSGTHWDRARDNPSDYHGDPYAFDMQALYDVITQKLNALGGKQMPAGARYGIHPGRIRKAKGQDIVNGDSDLNEFPHQSNPAIKTDKALKKQGWWSESKTAGEAQESFEESSVDAESPDSGGRGLTCKSGVEPLPNVLSFVPKVEQIMLARGLTVGARFQRRWWSGPANRLVGPQSSGMGNARPLSIETVSMDWVLSFDRARLLFENLQQTSSVFSSNGKQLLEKRINALFATLKPGQVQVNFGSYPQGLAREDQYINHMAMGEYSAYSAGIDDLNAALGRFTMFVIPKGVATRLENGRISVRVNELGIYIRDSYDFEGEQELGRWMLPDRAELTEPGGNFSSEKHGSMRMLCPDEWVYMSNWIYREYRNASGQFGEDFLVYSDIKVVVLDPPYVYEYTVAPSIAPQQSGPQASQTAHWSLTR